MCNYDINIVVDILPKNTRLDIQQFFKIILSAFFDFAHHESNRNFSRSILYSFGDQIRKNRNSFTPIKRCSSSSLPTKTGHTEQVNENIYDRHFIHERNEEMDEILVPESPMHRPNSLANEPHLRGMSPKNIYRHRTTITTFCLMT